MIQDEDPPIVVVLSDTKPIARKVHACGNHWCKEAIMKGEQYHRVTFIDEDGKLHCFKEHLKHTVYEGP